MRGARMGRKTGAVFKRRTDKADNSPVRLVLWTGIVAVLLTWIGAIQPFEDVLRVARNRSHVHPASGNIVLVPIDDRVLRDTARWPWPRRYHAQLIDRLSAAGAKNIFFDITFETRSNPVDDDLLAAAIARSRRVTLAVRGQSGPDRIAQDTPGPLPMFSRNARLASIGVSYNFQNAVWRLPYAADYNGALPSLASGLAGSGPRAGEFMLDYSIDLKSIPQINATNVLAGRFDPRAIAGKTVIVGIEERRILLAQTDGDGKLRRREFDVMELLPVGVIEGDRCIHHDRIQAAEEQVDIRMGLIVIGLQIRHANLMQIALSE